MALQRDGSRYYWRVRAANEDIETNWSKAGEFSLQQATPLRAGGARYYWRCKTYSDEGVDSGWSQVGCFEMAGAVAVDVELAPAEFSVGVKRVIKVGPAIELAPIEAEAGAEKGVKGEALPLKHDGSTYYWRVRTASDDITSPWSPHGRFDLSRMVESEIEIEPVEFSCGATVTPKTGKEITVESNIELAPVEFKAGAGAYRLIPLSYYERRYWRIRARDANGVISEYSSEDAFFSTGVISGEIEPAPVEFTCGVTVKRVWKPTVAVELAPIEATCGVTVAHEKKSLNVTSAIELAPVEVDSRIQAKITARPEIEIAPVEVNLRATQGIDIGGEIEIAPIEFGAGVGIHHEKKELIASASVELAPVEVSCGVTVTHIPKDIDVECGLEVAPVEVAGRIQAKIKVGCAIEIAPVEFTLPGDEASGWSKTQQYAMYRRFQQHYARRLVRSR